MVEPYCPCGGQCHHSPNPCSFSCLSTAGSFTKDLVLVRKNTGGVFPDGTTNHEWKPVNEDQATARLDRHRDIGEGE